MTAPLFIDGIGWWAPSLPGWPLARAALRGEAPAAAPIDARPKPTLLAANERRRAPDSVLLALQVASEALAGSGQDPATITSVFTSAHGDLAITDALCRTLAASPLLLSPTRFHHSVHNAASGYWAIASGSGAASTALAAGERSFAAGLLEAACQCAADALPVLLVGSDTQANGPLVSVNRSRGLLGLALVLAPVQSAASRWAVQWSLDAALAAAPAMLSPAVQHLAANAQADALPLFEALARDAASSLALPISAGLHLALTLQPLPSTQA